MDFSDFMAKGIGYGLEKSCQQKQLGVSLPLKPQRKSNWMISQRGLMHCWSWDFSGCIWNNFTNTTVEPRFFMKMSNEVRLEDLDWEKQTSMWALLFLRNEHNLFPLSNVCICHSVWQCSCLCFYWYNIDTVSLYMKRRMNISTEKSAVTKGPWAAWWKPECFFPRGL